MRLKLKGDIEAPFQLQLQAKDREISSTKEQLQAATRKAQIARTELEELRFEKEKELQQTKERLQAEVSELTAENSALQAKLDDHRDRDMIRDLRRELDEYKRRYADALTDSTDMRKARDEATSLIADLQVQHSSDLESERNKRRDLESQVDKLRFQLQCKDEEMAKEIKFREDLATDLQKSRDTVKTNEAVLREKEVLVDTMNRQIAELKTELSHKQSSFSAQIKQVTQEDRE